MTTPTFAKAIQWAKAQDAGAVRNSLSMAIPLAIGTAVGEPALGGLAAIGAFTTMYTHNKPYRQRVKQWLFIAGSLLVAFAAGTFTAGSLWAGVLTIGAAALVLTFLMRVVAMGPPGAYILVLACATGTHLPPDVSELGTRLLTVAAGSAIALIVCSAGWWTSPDNPERRALANAMRTVAAYLQPPVAPDDRPAADVSALRHRAQRAIHDVAVDLANASKKGTPGRLAEIVRELRHLTDTTFPERPATSPDRSTTNEVDDRTRAAEALKSIADSMQGSWPLRREHTEGYESLLVDVTLLRAMARPLTRDSKAFAVFPAFPGPFAIWKARTPRALRSAVRAGFAATAAGCVAVALQVDRPYWGAAAAVAVLANDGSRATFTRAWARFAGTIVGVLVAAGIIALHPSPVAIVLVVAGLQFLVQLVIARSYGIAVVAITPLALLLADAATGSTSLSDLLPRLIETAIGCGLALAARLLIFPNSSARHLPVVMKIVDSRKALWDSLSGAPSKESRTARLALERALLALEDAIGAASDELRPHPSTTTNIALAKATLDQTWPTVTLAPRTAEPSTETAVAKNARPPGSS